MITLAYYILTIYYVSILLLLLMVFGNKKRRRKKSQAPLLYENIITFDGNIGQLNSKKSFNN